MSTATEQQPWVEAAWDCVPLAAVPPPEYIRIIKLACERHAAALTQENQRLREQMQEGNARYSELFGKLESNRAALMAVKSMLEADTRKQIVMALIDAALKDKDGNP